MSNLESGNAFQRTAVGVRGMDLAGLTFQALGIIYSDLGTSPLYALNGIWPSSDPAPSQEDVIGGVSAIIWAITLVALLKYVIISLRFATREGEGGSFALFQGLYPRQVDDGTLERTLTGDYGRELKRFDQPKKPSVKERIRWPLLIWCLFGTALMMSDGIFTPAVSVTSAVGGIAVAKPDVADNIVPIAIGFILLIFLVQQFGTARLAVAFSPIALVWFGLLMGTGIYNITYHPGIFRAFDPSRAILLFVRTKNYDLLSGVLLALTGCEAVFANVGQFNALSIQLSFGTVVYPAVLFSYLGQGARLISNGDDIIENIFYRSIPGPVNGALFWIMFVFAILATLIASQALITATFSLLQQLIVMKSFPPLRMTYTSETMQGQVYISAVNWTLMISTIIVVAAFPNLRAMTNAYGFAVATVMLSTSVLIAIHIRYVKKFSIFLALAYVVFFGFLDALLWGASLKKVPEGAWVPLLIGGCLAISMCLWTWGKGLEDAFDAKNRQNLAEVVCFNRGNDNDDDELNESDDDEDDEPTLLYTMAPRSGANKDPSEKNTILERRPLVRTRNCAIFHKFTEGKGVPHSFIGLIRQWPSLPEVMIFLSVRIVPIARVPSEDRYIVSKTRSIPGCYGATYCVGFREKFNINNDELLDKICALERSLNSHHGRTTAERIRRVSGAVTHIVPYYYVISRQTNGGRLRPVVNWVRKALIENVYRRLATMFPQTANWNNSADEIIHVGINAII